MATVLTTLTSICSGGNHLTFTVEYGARTRTVMVERDRLTDEITDFELEQWCVTLARLVKVGRTNAQAASALQAGVSVTVP